MQTCDFLVIGSGVAGLAFALHASQHGSVVVLTKSQADESNTRYAQGGIAAVWDPDDTPEAHIRDTLVAGAGLCDRKAVEVTIREGPQRVREMIDDGVMFSRDEDGAYALGREGGHSVRRVLHANDSTGAEVVRALLAKARQAPGIQILERWIAVDLITSAWLDNRAGALPGPRNVVHGAYALELATGHVEVFAARVVLLATGGAGKVYLYTSNPDVASGDGMAMGWRAGARVANMEFIQFHPTCLYHPHAKNFLITEAMRGEGGVLRLRDGTAFISRYDSRKELAPRDIVARAIDAELKRTGEECAYLDMTHHSREFLQGRFPNVYETCRKFGVDIATDPIPVVPAAHYFCGGIDVDLCGESSVRNLFAVGETACTGLHGANRLASNSLLEALVFARRAADRAAERLPDLTLRTDLSDWDYGRATDSDEQVVITQVWEEIRRFMWNYVGIVRTTRRLKRARRRIQLVRDEIHHYYWDFRLSGDLVELRNLATVAGLVVESALLRCESRGLHYTMDFPDPDPRFLRDTFLDRGEEW